MKACKRILVTGLLAGLWGASAMAQQTTGTPGSPGATTTISGEQLQAGDELRHQLAQLSGHPLGRQTNFETPEGRVGRGLFRK